jgi:HlyD family secretion protein
MKKLIVTIAVFAVLLAGVGYWYWHRQAADRTVFRHDEVTRGRLVATIGSTGTVQAQDVVDVGAQVAGRIVSISEDKLSPRRNPTEFKRIDWGSIVKGPLTDKDGKPVLNPDGTMKEPGTLLAQIDPAIYAAQVKANEAALKAAQADLLQKKAVQIQKTADWNRNQKLFKENGIAPQEYDQSKADFEVANANVEVSKANIEVALANLANARTNLEYTSVTSPVDGVVIDRRVNVGQTVVASLSAPSLFLIAKDLRKLEVWATVNEVDVSKIRADQDVVFTVDSLPRNMYKGKVVEQGSLPFRLNATMNQNVVTYTVVVSVNNDDGLLKPYMTTNLTFIVDDLKDVLLVPNAALRWQPSKQQIAPDLRDSYAKLKAKKKQSTDPDERGFVWVQDDNGYVRYVELQLGPSDSVKTEVRGVVGGDELPVGTQVITGEGKAGTRSGGVNPFSVQMFKKKE